MKSIKQLSFIGLAIALVLTSCTMEKRVYMSGYHIEWKKSKHNPDRQELASNDNVKQTGQNQTVSVEQSINETNTADNFFAPTVTDDNITASVDNNSVIIPSHKSVAFDKKVNTVTTKTNSASETKTVIASKVNSGFKKLAVQWLNEVLCFVSSSVLADSFVLRNRQLLKPANRYSYQFKSKCYGSGPTYYSTRQLNVYESMSTESAVSSEIPKGVAVEVTNSFFGEHGWWEVCYEGDKGWVKKAYLTKKQTVQKTQTYQDDDDNSSISSTDQDTDVGFEPFLAKANSSVNFRTAPSTSSSVIRQLQAGTQVYVFSKQDANGFYKAIDIKTGKIGWVSKSLVLIK
jgi:uncharacterized protein YgiM (DUF1202 family)